MLRWQQHKTKTARALKFHPQTTSNLKKAVECARKEELAEERKNCFDPKIL